MEVINQFDTTVKKALSEIDKKWIKYLGLVVVGSHTPQNVEETINKIKEARENHLPFLGICMGMQLAIIEYARNVLKLKNANSTEIDFNTRHPVIIKMTTLRVGIRDVEWNGKVRQESHWHNYKFNDKYLIDFQDDWQTSFTDGVLEVMKLNNHHKFFVGAQYHPEYESSQEKPHPLLKEFLKICKKK